MDLRRIAGGALGFTIGLTLLPLDAHAQVIARVTQHGYIMVDEPGAPNPYGGQVPVDTTTRFQFIVDVTNAIADYPGAPRGEFLAVMQTRASTGPGLAYYEGIRNDVTG